MPPIRPFHVYLRTVYLLGSTENGHLAHVALSADGRVLGADAPAQAGRFARYGFAHYGDHGDCLYFLNEAGEKQARLRYSVEANGFFPDDEFGLYLVPLITLAPPQIPIGNARLVVNTIPKSGTYLLDLILADIGYHGVGLHLIARECHDNRGIAPEVIHRNPFSRRVFAPPSAVARVMMAGECALGHIADAAQLRMIEQAGVGIINCQRNLRDVLVSLFRFKRASVDAVSPADRAWRHLQGANGFLAFLCAYADGEIADLGEFAQLMRDLPGVLLRFEDLIQGRIPEPEIAALDQLDAGLGAMMAELLPGCLGRRSSTLTAQRSDWRALWSPAAEEFFRESGLLKANLGMGYE